MAILKMKRLRLMIARAQKDAMLRELIRMNVAERIDLGKRDARAVAAVHGEIFEDLLRRRLVAGLLGLEVHIDAVAVVVDGQDFFLHA